MVIPMIRKSVLIIAIFLLPHFAEAQTNRSMPSIDLDTARRYFMELRNQCTKDDGALWGISLCVPVAFIDPQTRQIVTNWPDSLGVFDNQHDIYTGIWPANLPVSNSTDKYNGTTWSTIIWPPPVDNTARISLMLHESFHNVEESMGIRAGTFENSHLGTKEGRIWLRLEWEALRKALLSEGYDRISHIKNALIFREYRRSLFRGSAESERKMELYEGLAEYTGLRLCGLSLSEAALYLSDTAYFARLNVPSFEKSFAYYSGPAYGFLLDLMKVKWRDTFKPTDDLGNLLKTALNITLSVDLEQSAGKSAPYYNGAIIRSEETDRALENQKRIADFKSRLIDGPHLDIPLRQMNLEYDPRRVISLDIYGTLYPSIRISDLWGVLIVTDSGALISPEWNRITVSSPGSIEGVSITGNGWKLEMNDGWEIVPGTRQGDFVLQGPE